MDRMIRFACALVLLCARPLHAQVDTVHISLKGAEEAFMRNNLQLLAGRFQIEASHAAVTQAGLWNNPTLGLEQNVYNQYSKKWLDVTASGNSGVQIQQLLVLAGKRAKQVRIAEVNAEMSELEFSDVVRVLKRELRIDLYDLHFLCQSLAFYDTSIAALSKTVELTENVYHQRAVLLSELLRIKELLFSLQNERLGLLTRIASAENEIRVLIGDTSAPARRYVPDLNPGQLEGFRPDSLTLSRMIALANENRPDLRKAEAAIRLEGTNLSSQKALAIPDVTIGGLWSRAGSYIPNYYALTLSIDLPFFNRNQGNIQVSERTIQANTLFLESLRASVRREVIEAYERVARADSLYHSFDRQFLVQYSSLFNGTVSDYEKRYITVIEFTDFIEAYRTSLVQMNQLENERADAFEELNYVTGTDLMTP